MEGNLVEGNLAEGNLAEDTLVVDNPVGADMPQEVEGTALEDSRGGVQKAPCQTHHVYPSHHPCSLSAKN